jgi:hypothetical protein
MGEISSVMVADQAYSHEWSAEDEDEYQVFLMLFSKLMRRTSYIVSGPWETVFCVNDFVLSVSYAYSILCPSFALSVCTEKLRHAVVRVRL